MFVFSLKNRYPFLCRAAMVIYTVTVNTGDRAMAGTNSYIYIQLRGTEDESDEQCFRGFCQGSVSAPN